MVNATASRPRSRSRERSRSVERTGASSSREVTATAGAGAVSATEDVHQVKLPAGPIPVFVYLLAVVAIGTAIPIYYHYQLHAVFNVHHALQAFFLWLNTNIAYWEICLLVRRDQVNALYRRHVGPYKGRSMYRAAEIMMYRVSPRALFHPSLWADVWAMYSLMDKSYASKKTFGFWIDVGNGFSTLLPCLGILAGMTWDLVSARTLGVVLLLFSYQMWYGTVVYMAGYLLNRRYEGHTKFEVGLFVLFTNGFWATLPLHGMYVALQLIYSNAFTVLGY